MTPEHSQRSALVRQNNRAELDAFERTCNRLAGFNHQLEWELVDGFLASLAAAPRLPAPAEWLPALCGDAFERAFADPDDQAQALRSLQARLAVLRDQLDPQALFDDPDSLRLEPLVADIDDAGRQRLIDEEGFSAESAAQERPGAVWADGFFSGMAAFGTLWTVPTEEGAQAVFDQAFDHIRALQLVPGNDGWKAHMAAYYAQVDEPDSDDLLAEACLAVQDLRLYWIDFAPTTATRRVEPTPGRNDPCPCGSGRKYKKCHGA